MRVQVDDVRLWFDIDGEKERLDGEGDRTKPTLVLIHGGPGADHRFSKRLGARLSDIAQVVLLDLRGHGRSSRSEPSRWNLDTWADDVAGFCRVLEIDRPVILGTSFGGFVAQALASRHPDLASKLILIATAARLDKNAVIKAFSEHGEDEAAAAAANFFRDPANGEASVWYSKVCLPLYSKTSPAAMDQAIKGERWAADVFAWYARPEVGEFYTADFRAGLKFVVTPTLVITGESDPITPVAAAEELRDAFSPGAATLKVLGGASHAVYVDAQDEVVRLVRGFLLGEDADR